MKIIINSFKVVSKLILNFFLVFGIIYVFYFDIFYFDYVNENTRFKYFCQYSYKDSYEKIVSEYFKNETEGDVKILSSFNPSTKTKLDGHSCIIEEGSDLIIDLFYKDNQITTLYFSLKMEVYNQNPRVDSDDYYYNLLREQYPTFQKFGGPYNEFVFTELDEWIVFSNSPVFYIYGKDFDMKLMESRWKENDRVYLFNYETEKIYIFERAYYNLYEDFINRESVIEYDEENNVFTIIRPNFRERKGTVTDIYVLNQNNRVYEIKK